MLQTLDRLTQKGARATAYCTVQCRRLRSSIIFDLIDNMMMVMVRIVVTLSLPDLIGKVPTEGIKQVLNASD